MTSAAGLLGGHAYFLHWGVIQISAANLTVVVLMVLVFALAVVVPFPRAHDDDGSSDAERSEGPDARI